MSTKWRIVAGVVAGLTLVGTGAVLVQTGVASETLATEVGPGTRPAAGRSTMPRTVTLITGDRVTVTGGQHVSIERGAGRAGMRFRTDRAGDRLRVLPMDAAPLVAAGLLDARLFDIDRLLEYGYDRRDHLPLIIAAAGVTASGTAAARSARDGVTGVAGVAVVRELPAVGAVAARQSRASATASWPALLRTMRGKPGQRAAGKVWLDGLHRPTVDSSVPQVGAPAAWAAGLTGAGVTVAVVDSGVDDSHPDLAGRVAARRNFTDGAEDDRDRAGHGTHVASTLAGTGAASNGRYRGVAPGARLLDAKVCTADGCAESSIVAGMEWASGQGAKIVNVSLGGYDDPAVVDPVEQAVQSLSESRGTLFVVSAGNLGQVKDNIDGTVTSPGGVPAALTVGAVDHAGKLADFSSAGPVNASGAVKPDITAPGVDITAARSKDATYLLPGPVDGYANLSGTSMATPHVAGAAAILAQQHPGWTGSALKAGLMNSAVVDAASSNVYHHGAGRLDIARSVRQAVTTTPASVSFGAQSWPHQDDPVTAKPVVYHNHGTSAVTLQLAVRANDEAGAPTPAGMFSLSASTLVVPAGGAASVRLTANTRVSGPTGLLGGRIVATAGEIVVQTPSGVHSEPESYDVTIVHTDRGGAVPAILFASLARYDSRRLPDVQVAGTMLGYDGTVTMRMPRGRYALISTITSADQQEHMMLSQPVLEVDRTMTIRVDGRLSRPVSVTVPRPGAVAFTAGMSASVRRSTGTVGMSMAVDTFAGLYAGRLGPDVGHPDFLFQVSGEFAEAAGDGSVTDSPYAYLLLFPEPGRMVDGFQRSVVDSELAQVRADFARANPGTVGAKRVFPVNTAFGEGAIAQPMPFRLPFARTEYYNVSPGVEWVGEFSETDGDEHYAFQLGGLVAYHAGKQYREDWNKGVFGPSFPNPPIFLAPGITRTRERIGVEMPLYTDGHGRGGMGNVTGTTTLDRNGVRIAESAAVHYQEIAVPPGAALYRLKMHAQRPAPAELSTSVTTEWRFRSAAADHNNPVPLPLWGARFTTELDKHNAVAAGRTQKVTLVLTPQPGAVVGRPGQPTVEISFDDGVTWRRAPVIQGAFEVSHPRGAGYVSLRVAVTDSAGNAVQQTVVHAYRYGAAG